MPNNISDRKAKGDAERIVFLRIFKYFIIIFVYPLYEYNMFLYNMFVLVPYIIFS